MEIIMNTTNYSYTIPARIIHMGLAFFGIFAYLTAEGAEHSDSGFGYQLHAYLGLTLMAIIILRVFRGYSGPAEMRFSSWSPFNKSQWTVAIADMKNLLQIKIPDRGMHEGLAGLVQAFGLIIFAWMGATGTALYFIDESSFETLYEIFEETHEVGESLIPLFLVLHVGAVVAHTLAGKSNWKKMWSFSK
jgi:cytochrome b